MKVRVPAGSHDSKFKALRIEFLKLRSESHGKSLGPVRAGLPFCTVAKNNCCEE